MLLATVLLPGFGFGQAPAANPSTTPDPMKQHYTAAGSFLAEGDPQHAALEYKAFLTEALHRIANADAQIADVPKASELFAQAIEFAKPDSALLDDYAAFRFDHGQMAEAETLLNTAIEVNHNDVRAHLLLGRVLFNQEKYLAAKPHFEFALAHGEVRDVWFLLAVTDLKLQQLAVAQELLGKVLGTVHDSAVTRFRMGLAYYTGDYPDQAIVEFKRAIALNPKGLDYHYYLGLAYLGHNPEAGFVKAEPEFRAELALSPTDFRGYYMLGYIALKQGRMKESGFQLEKARSLRPDDIGTLVLTAELYVGTARDGEAEPLLRKVIALAANTTVSYELIRAHYMLGRLLQRGGHVDEAANELATSEELRLKFRAASGGTPKERTVATPQSDEAPRAVSPEDRANAQAFIRELSSPITEAFNNLGAIAANQHQCPDTISYFEHAGEWMPSLEGLDLNLGRAAFLCSQYEKAVPPLSRYLEQHPENANARSTLGLSLFRLQEYEKVVEVLRPIEPAVQSNPELLNAYTTSLANVKTGGQ